jgi:transcription elongation factor Elf1
MTALDAIVVPIDCGQCGHRTHRSLGALKTFERVYCPSCGAKIALDIRQLARASALAETVVGKLKSSTTPAPRTGA